MAISFRHSAGFGKRMEYYIIGLMLKKGIDCYVPLIDDDGDKYCANDFSRLYS